MLMPKKVKYRKQQRGKRAGKEDLLDIRYE